MDTKIARLVGGVLLGIVGVICGTLVIIFGPEGSTPLWGYLIAMVAIFSGYLIAIL